MEQVLLSHISPRPASRQAIWHARGAEADAPGRIRTSDLSLRRRALYPLSYGRGRASLAALRRAACDARRSRRSRRRAEACRKRGRPCRRGASRSRRRRPRAGRGGQAASPGDKSRAARRCGARGARGRPGRRARSVAPRARRRGGGRRPGRARPRRGRRRGSPAAVGSREDVEALDVARAFPDRVDGRLAVEARQHRLLDVAVAAEALERLGHVAGRHPADPVLGDRGRKPAKGDVALVVRARDAQRGRGRGLRLDAEVGQHVAHQRLLGEQAAEGGPVRGVVGRLGDGAAHDRGRPRARSRAACG